MQIISYVGLRWANTVSSFIECLPCTHTELGPGDKAVDDAGIFSVFIKPQPIVFLRDIL